MAVLMVLDRMLDHGKCIRQSYATTCIATLYTLRKSVMVTVDFLVRLAISLDSMENMLSLQDYTSSCCVTRTTNYPARLLCNTDYSAGLC